MSNKKLNFDIVRVNFNLPKKLVDRVNDYAIELGIPKTYAMVLLLNKGLETTTMINELPKLNKFIDDYNLGKYKELTDSNE